MRRSSRERRAFPPAAAAALSPGRLRHYFPSLPPPLPGTGAAEGIESPLQPSFRRSPSIQPREGRVLRWCGGRPHALPQLSTPSLCSPRFPYFITHRRNVRLQRPGQQGSLPPPGLTLILSKFSACFYFPFLRNPILILVYPGAAGASAQSVERYTGKNAFKEVRKCKTYRCTGGKKDIFARCS